MSNQLSCTCPSEQPCARKVPIFAALTDAELAQVVSLITQKSYPKGSLVFREGEPLENLYLINHGRIKVYRTAADGKEQILYVLSEGDFLGERNLLRSKPAEYTAETLEDTQVCVITRQDCQQLLLRYPSISLKIIDELNKRLDKLELLFGNVSPRETDKRICLMLLEFLEKYGTKQADQTVIIDLPLNREEMANYIGLTRETVSRRLNTYKEAGIIDFIGNKKLVILDVETLKEACQY
ncbi:MAG: Crp/Fnr family transcriptional regulator [Firmicutes bacterium]|nr:Crp/Fnr family transcriptional regulator [Bacillota bacterium]